MKYQLLFTTCLLQQAISQQVLPQAQSSYSDMSKSIEDKVKADLMMQLQQTEFTNQFNMPLPKTQEVSIDTTMQLTYPDLHGLLQKLSMLLKDRDVIASMWPEASNYADTEIFDYLHIEFDSHEEKVKLATVATDVKG